MGILVENITISVQVSLSILKIIGFWAPEDLDGRGKLLYSFYTIFSLFFLGNYLILQVVDLYYIWGNITTMTANALLMFTNMAHAVKILNILVRKKRIGAIVRDANIVLSQAKNQEERDIVNSSNKEMAILQVLYFSVTLVTCIGWVTSAEKGALPFRVWYPYDATKTPAYELTYFYQVVYIFIAAYVNIAKDTLVAALIAQCRCRFRLVGNALKNLGKGLDINDKYIFTREHEYIVSSQLRWCVEQHQKALEAAAELQACFWEPTFAQFTVSLVIICATAFQLSMLETGNMVRLLSTGTYLMNMVIQVFIYCYQGNQLSEESSEISEAAYWCPWYKCSVRLRRAVLVIMVRARRVITLTAGPFTPLSLTTFMAVIKASYSLFTLLQQVNEK